MIRVLTLVCAALSPSWVQEFMHNRKTTPPSVVFLFSGDAAGFSASSAKCYDAPHLGVRSFQPHEIMPELSSIRKRRSFGHLRAMATWIYGDVEMSSDVAMCPC